mgnify:FL=1
MKIKDYSIIKTAYIDNLIEDLEIKFSNTPRTKHSAKSDSLLKRIELLQEIKSKLKPLTEIVENALDAGKLSEQNAYLSSGIDRKQDYINNTEV